MRLAPLPSLALALALPLGGCGSGETGSPDCAGPSACLCDTLNTAGTLMRVHVESADSGSLVAAVDSVFWTVNSDVAWVEVGDRVAGALTAQEPCGGDDASAPPARESDLLVLYSPGVTGGFPNCDDFLACAERDCSNLSEPELTDCWATCDTETTQVCSEQRTLALLDGVFAFAIPWSEPFAFGEDKLLTQTDLEVLRTPEACLDRFPAEPAPACNDVVTSTCTVTRPAPAAPTGQAMTALVGLMLLATVRRLRPARTRPKAC